jgi:hypothetical protein
MALPRLDWRHSLSGRLRHNVAQQPCVIAKQARLSRAAMLAWLLQMGWP